MNNSNTPSSFDNCFLDMTLKSELSIVPRCLCSVLITTSDPLKKQKRMNRCIPFLGKYDLLVFVRIKLHFPLIGPNRYDLKISV